MLVTVEGFQEFFEEQISQHVIKRAERSIKETESFDLKVLLGKSLYYDIVNNPTEQKYIDIIEGVDYQNADENTVSFDGLQVVIYYYAFARLLESPSGIIFARYGAVNKVTNLGEQTDAKAIKEAAAKMREIAKNYFYEVADYLDFKSEDYPLWKTSCATNDFDTDSVVISKVTSRKYPNGKH